LSSTFLTVHEAVIVPVDDILCEGCLSVGAE